MTPLRCLLFGLSLPLMGWGTQGHRLAAEGSLRTLPPHLRVWYQNREADYIRASLEPDFWKERDPEETGRHRIFCEAYGGASKVPLQESLARSQVSPWTFVSSGQLPWVIAERYRLLVKAFQAGDPAGVVKASGWLGHYIADAQVPLHTTQNRNGKQTAQKGVHKRWETDLVAHGVTELWNLRSATPPSNIPNAISGWIRDSHVLVAPLLQADRTATLGAGTGEADPIALFWKDQQGAVLLQLQRSSEYTGDLLLAAWVEAGRPLRP